MIPKSVKRSDVFDAGAFVAFLGSRRSVIESASDDEIRGMLDRARGAVVPAASGGSRAGDVAGGGPAIVTINHDDYHAKHVGRTADGRQFFLTTPFVPADGAEPGREFVALFLFDGSGRLVEAKIDDLGPRTELDEEAAQRAYDARLAELGVVTFGRIEVAPFSVGRFGTEFGLIPHEPEHEGDVWAVEMQPGNYMAFYEPWDGGDYDT